MVICPKFKKGYIVMGKIHYTYKQTTLDVRVCKEQRYNIHYVIVIWQSTFVKLAAEGIQH